MAPEWHTRDVRLGGTSYPYYFGRDCMPRIVAALAAYEPDIFFVVTDDTVLALHGDPLVQGLSRHAPVHVLSSPAGEGMKTMATLTAYLEEAVAVGATRRSLVVAFGGGVPGNVAGTVAGLLFRGVRFVHVPTTTVAAMDSVISLKQAINSSHGKNHIGLYHGPLAIYTDVGLLASLPPRELRSGMCEATKNCLAIRPAAIPALREMLAADKPTDPDLLLRLLDESVAAKCAVTAHDGTEQRAGLVLEYGHTVGHAVELCDQRLRGPSGISHGEAVAFGMAVAARVSALLGGLSAAEVAVHDELVNALGAPLRLTQEMSVPDVMGVVRADNKRGYLNLKADEAAMVLLHSLGQPQGNPECPLVAAPLSAIEMALADLQRM
jgi:3-dehydroquinate synthetase